MNQYKHSICLVTCCFEQQLPEWADYFFMTAGWNSSVDFIVFTDCEAPSVLAPNIHFVQMGLEAFSGLASQQLGIDVTVSSPDKLMDFRPAYGKIFADYIDKYDFWGHVGTDILLGNIREFLTDNLLGEIDYFTVREGFPAGYFSLYRNVESVNQLFMQSKDWKDVFGNPQYTGFDETDQTYNAYLKSRVVSPHNTGVIVSMDDVLNGNSHGLRIHKQAVSHELGTRELLEITRNGIQLVGKEGRLMVVSFKCFHAQPAFVYPPIKNDDSKIYVDEFGLRPCPSDLALTVAERDAQLLDMQFEVNYETVSIQMNGETSINIGVNEWFDISKCILISTQILLYFHNARQATGHQMVDFFIQSKFFTIQKKVPPNKAETEVFMLNMISRLVEFGHLIVKQ